MEDRAAVRGLCSVARLVLAVLSEMGEETDPRLGEVLEIFERWSLSTDPHESLRNASSLVRSISTEDQESMMRAEAAMLQAELSSSIVEVVLSPVFVVSPTQGSQTESQAEVIRSQAALAADIIMVRGATREACLSRVEQAFEDGWNPRHEAHADEVGAQELPGEQDAGSAMGTPHQGEMARGRFDEIAPRLGSQAPILRAFFRRAIPGFDEDSLPLTQWEEMVGAWIETARHHHQTSDDSVTARDTSVKARELALMLSRMADRLEVTQPSSGIQKASVLVNRLYACVFDDDPRRTVWIPVVEAVHLAKDARVHEVMKFARGRCPPEQRLDFDRKLGWSTDPVNLIRGLVAISNLATSRRLDSADLQRAYDAWQPPRGRPKGAKASISGSRIRPVDDDLKGVPPHWFVIKDLLAKLPASGPAPNARGLKDGWQKYKDSWKALGGADFEEKRRKMIWSQFSAMLHTLGFGPYEPEALEGEWERLRARR